MKKTVLTAVFSSILLCTNVFADVGVWGTSAKVWSLFSDFQKTVYVQGIMDALIFSDGRIEGVDITYETSIDHLTSALDEFYDDYRNHRIPVPYALKVISMEMAGASSSDVEVELRNLRKQFNGS